jgi:hypothetical protein
VFLDTSFPLCVSIPPFHSGISTAIGARGWAFLRTGKYWHLYIVQKSDAAIIYIRMVKSQPLLYICVAKPAQLLSHSITQYDCEKNFRLLGNGYQWVKGKRRKNFKKRLEKVWIWVKECYFCTRNQAAFLRHFETNQVKKIFEKKLKKDLDCKE